MTSAETLVSAIRRVGRPEPILVAVDGRSAAGKSTLAAEVAGRIAASVIDGDDFYAGGSEAVWDAMSAAEMAAHCIDWRRQRSVLETLARGEEARWHAYDWDAGDGRLMEQPTICPPSPTVILEGAYSARPELADLFHLRVLYDAPTGLRHRRWFEREGEGYDDDWARRWSKAEDWYFARVMPPEEFDLVIPAE
jgi:uridine kinase